MGRCEKAMSYIRSTSNPEALYIVGTGKNVEIYRGGRYAHLLPHTIPTRTLKMLLRKWNVGNHDDETYGGARVREIKVKNGWKIELSYEDWKIRMWPVTWYYIASHERDG